MPPGGIPALNTHQPWTSIRRPSQVLNATQDGGKMSSRPQRQIPRGTQTGRHIRVFFFFHSKESGGKEAPVSPCLVPKAQQEESPSSGIRVRPRWGREDAEPGGSGRTPSRSLRIGIWLWGWSLVSTKEGLAANRGRQAQGP